MSGKVFLVVGPSGAGKDTLLDQVRPKLPEHIFVKRHITRPKESVGEDHHPISTEEFNHRIENGGFCVHWQAHGLNYGIDSTLIDQVRAGRDAIVNCSRSKITKFQQVFDQVTVIQVTATRDVLRRRLQERGRESAADVEARLARNVLLPESDSVITIDNSGDLRTAAAQLLNALTGCTVH